MADHRMVYHWRHGWIPLTHAAALSKFHGSRGAADKYMSSDKVPLHRRNLGGHSDEQLSALLSDAVTGGDERHVDVVIAELERRDVAARMAKQAARKAAERRAVRADRDRAVKGARYDELVNAGHDPEQAYAEAFGVSVAKQRQQDAITQLRDHGYKGAGFHELSRNAYREELDRMYFAAEAATRGHLLTGEGERRGIDARSVFRGNESVARRYASEELKQFWDEHGRLTIDDFRASLLGGSMKERTAGDSWHR